MTNGFIFHRPLAISTRLGIYLLGLGLGATCIDYLSGPNIQATIVIAIPAVLAGWHGLMKIGLLMSVLLPLVRFLIEMLVWNAEVSGGAAGVNVATRIAVLVTLTLFARRAALARELSRRVRILEGILPICSYCKMIRDDNDAWHPLEAFISQRSEVMFSHGFCPDCAQKHFGDLIDEASERQCSR